MDWELLRVAAGEEMRHMRTARAQALRAIRRVDRPLARFARKRWRDDDKMAKVVTDMLIYGMGAYKIEHVPIAEVVRD
jgi:hypothetical protein